MKQMSHLVLWLIEPLETASSIWKLELIKGCVSRMYAGVVWFFFHFSVDHLEELRNLSCPFGIMTHSSSA